MSRWNSVMWEGGLICVMCARCVGRGWRLLWKYLEQVVGSERPGSLGGNALSQPPIHLATRGRKKNCGC